MAFLYGCAGRALNIPKWRFPARAEELQHWDGGYMAGFENLCDAAHGWDSRRP
jgi:hypothetical protein